MTQVERTHTVIKVKVLPRSSRNQVAIEEGEGYRIKLTAPPVEGKANSALRIFLANSLGLSKSHISIISGEHSRLKSVRIEGLSLEEVERRLGGA